MLVSSAPPTAAQTGAQRSAADRPSHVTGAYTEIDGETYFKIANSHGMPDFFMSLVGPSDHWMFVSSVGALTAGRCDPDSALFPYAADDQITSARANTGSMTLLRIRKDQGTELWEPFSTQTPLPHGIHRNLYKTPLGNKVLFEEVHESHQLAFRYRWAFSERFGFVRTCRLENLSEAPQSIDLLDGLRNLLPYGVGSEFVMRYSNLANAYKKNELLTESGVALYYLSSIPTDRAEPSEGLKTTVVWQTGLSPQAILLTTDQVGAFQDGQLIETEHDARGKAGAYAVHQTLDLQGGESIQWHVVADVAQDHSGVIQLHDWLRQTEDPTTALEQDIQSGQLEFQKIVASADGLQHSANPRRTNRHLANTVFNVMRGGIPLESYQIDADDFRRHVDGFNHTVYQRNQAALAALPSTLATRDLQAALADAKDPDLTRLTLEYLPLAFSRRHGDPTRPWNRFAIKLRSDSGRTNLDYQGNWRDIFQNWEALAFSFPEFSTAMVCRFVNATTADGYNPYRLTKNGFEWEEPSPDDPWGNIGYWGDHQIIYLLKLLEWSHRISPEALDRLLDKTAFVHANIPYRIRAFEDIKTNPRSTIDFDAALSNELAQRVASLGADGKLLCNRDGEIQRVTLMEKLLTLSLAKVSNFIPDGGIWLNTQRPEWNDANNALVGNGLSMVTTAYLYRWFRFLHDWLDSCGEDSFSISVEVSESLQRITTVLAQNQPEAHKLTDATQRSQIAEALSRAGSDYRHQLYTQGVSGTSQNLPRSACLEFFQLAIKHLEVTIQNNRRPDGLYHTYNLMHWQGNTLEVAPLYEMLEGQVAVLSSGLLSPTEAITLLDALRKSRLYRANQNSYLLYPDRKLCRFLEKNTLSEKQVSSSPLLQTLLETGNEQIVRRDHRGSVHFNGSFRNAADLSQALRTLPETYQNSAQTEHDHLLRQFEDLFDHHQFTGRSGTFFAYEGLGSIYWHMVSKLALAVSENFFMAIDSGTSEATIQALREHYRNIQQGIGAEKSPLDYGAFPTDPYSHTPENAGVKQPGMTGQVKEDFLSRFLELGVHVESGCLRFRPELVDRSELVAEAGSFTHCTPDGTLQTITIPKNGMGLTVCQTPLIWEPGTEDRIQIQSQSGETRSIDGLRLDPDTTQALFARNHAVQLIRVQSKDLIPKTV